MSLCLPSFKIDIGSRKRFATPSAANKEINYQEYQSDTDENCESQERVEWIDKSHAPYCERSSECFWCMTMRMRQLGHEWRL